MIRLLQAMSCPGTLCPEGWRIDGQPEHGSRLMTLPAWTAEGLLPPGSHAAGLPDVYERCVLDAPNRDCRELLYSALDVHLRLIQTVIPCGVAWIDGSFCRCRREPPDDVDVVIKPADWAALRGATGAAKAKLYALLTLQGAYAIEPAVDIPRLQPVGGAVDAFLCHPGQDDYWRAQWSAVLDAGRNVVSGKVKGFVEVAW